MRHQRVEAIVDSLFSDTMRACDKSQNDSAAVAAVKQAACALRDSEVATKESRGMHEYCLALDKVAFCCGMLESALRKAGEDESLDRDTAIGLLHQCDRLHVALKEAQHPGTV